MIFELFETINSNIDMTDFLLTLGVALLYLSMFMGEFYQKSFDKPRYVSWWLTLVACVAQAYLLHRWIDVAAGQNLSGVNLFALITWLAAVILLIGRLSMPIAPLGLLIYPLAVISTLLAALWPGRYILPTMHHPQFLFHILLSTGVVSLLVLGGCQAALLAWQEYHLRHKKWTGLVSRLPPLQWMEALLFQLVKLAVLALSLLLIFSIHMFGTAPIAGLWSKTALTLCIWLVFVGLLLGRHFFGWRANTAVIWAAIGVILAILVYLGSHFLLSL